MRRAWVGVVVLAAGCGVEADPAIERPEPEPAAVAVETAKPERRGNLEIREATPAAKRFVRAKLAELDQFKGSERFREFGFAGGEPGQWVKSVRAAQDREDFGFLGRVAVGDLEGLGMAYLRSQGQETKATQTFREYIFESIPEASPKPVAQTRPDPEPELEPAPDLDATKPARLLRMAKALEGRNPQGAIGYYRELIDDHPDSPEADEAKGRLEALEKP